jgi:putative ATP-dependent DNA ligase
MIDVVAEALGIDRSRVEYLASHKTIRFRVFRGILYAMLKRDLGEYYEGTVVIFGRGWSRVVPGYPHIQRVVLPSVALPRHFIDKIVVEEKLNGYNVRVVLVDNNIYAITRGGFICPYTTNRITRMLGEKLKSMFRELDPEDYFVAGEVIGLENPYTRHYYPEAPRFGYFVFDLFYRGTPMPPSKRDEVTESYGVPHVPVLGIIDKNDIEGFKEIVKRLNNDGREGVVLRDPEYRVPPLKYTTTYTNIEDIRIGMRFFMEEGRSFLFSRVIREIFRAYEEDLGPNKIEQLATEIGLAILEPAIDTVRSVARGVSVYEEFELEFSNEDELNEFIEYMSEMGIDIVVLRKTKRNGMILAKLGKMKETAIQVKKILESGLAPID